MTESNRVDIKTAAELIGVTPLWLRNMMRSGSIDIGHVYKVGSNRYTYIVLKEKLDKYLGIS